MGNDSMADNYQTEKYLTILGNLGPTRSLILIDKLMIDLKNTRRGFHAALSTKTFDLLNEPSNVLISLADAIGVNDLYGAAKYINEHNKMDKEDFPSEEVKRTLTKLDNWLDFLKSDKIQRERAS
jgi:hypothetical protein